MEYTIREMHPDEYGLLDDFLYEAIFVPAGTEPPPRAVVELPELQVYIAGFGQRDDTCLIAEVGGKPAGAAWARIMNDYGHVDEATPSLAVSLYRQYRGAGIGTAMMRELLRVLKQKGYRQASLSVQKTNYAVRMYLNVGFVIVEENDEDYIMVCKL